MMAGLRSAPSSQPRPDRSVERHKASGCVSHDRAGRTTPTITSQRLRQNRSRRETSGVQPLRVPFLAEPAVCHPLSRLSSEAQESSTASGSNHWDKKCHPFPLHGVGRFASSAWSHGAYSYSPWFWRNRGRANISLPPSNSAAMANSRGKASCSADGACLRRIASNGTVRADLAFRP